MPSERSVLSDVESNGPDVAARDTSDGEDSGPTRLPRRRSTQLQKSYVIDLVSDEENFSDPKEINNNMGTGKKRWFLDRIESMLTGCLFSRGSSSSSPCRFSSPDPWSEDEEKTVHVSRRRETKFCSSKLASGGGA